MEQIYVTGHRNPDTDSIVSAMAYAALRNATGDRQYVAARLGHISDETRLILSRFNFEPPALIQSMRTQVQDLDFDVPPILHEAVTVNRAWSEMQEDSQISAIPVTDDEAVNAFEYLSKTEGIIPAIESAHAVAHAMQLTPAMTPEQIIVITISGRGDKDCAAIARYRGEDIYE